MRGGGGGGARKGVSWKKRILRYNYHSQIVIFIGYCARKGGTTLNIHWEKLALPKTVHSKQAKKLSMLPTLWDRNY
jgi:coenzyme F420-reducing hydrogenase gamma subunit